MLFTLLVKFGSFFDFRLLNAILEGMERLANDIANTVTPYFFYGFTTYFLLVFSMLYFNALNNNTSIFSGKHGLGCPVPMEKTLN